MDLPFNLIKYFYGTKVIVSVYEIVKAPFLNLSDTISSKDGWLLSKGRHTHGPDMLAEKTNGCKISLNV